MCRAVKTKFTVEQADWMREHYPTTYNQACCDYLGVSMRTMIRFARSLGLTKDPEFVKSISREHCRLMASLNRGEGNAGKANLLIHGERYRFRKGESIEMRKGKAAWEAAKEKIRQSRNETIRKERMRIKWGLPQQTKLKLVCNRKAASTRYCLKRCGYIVEGRGAKCAYYTDCTDRCERLEKTAASCGIDILPMVQCQ